MAGRPRAFSTVDELQRGIDAYIAEETANDFPITVAGLAAYLGIGRTTLFEYADGKYGDPYSNAIKRAVAIIEADKLKKALKGQYNATIAIFDLKNNHGYRDQREVRGEHKITAGIHELSDEELAAIAAGGG